jgi:hypothetical protein
MWLCRGTDCCFGVPRTMARGPLQEGSRHGGGSTAFSGCENSDDPLASLSLFLIYKVGTVEVTRLLQHKSVGPQVM